eukprot:SAG11_NODE_736_length_7449_cov_2.560816_4_plen_315_part_00
MSPAHLKPTPNIWPDEVMKDEVSVQFRGHDGAWEHMYMELLKNRVLAFRKEVVGPALRYVNVSPGSTVQPPKKPRKGHEYTLILKCPEPGTGGVMKFGLAFTNDRSKDAWMRELTKVAALSNSAVHNMKLTALTEELELTAKIEADEEAIAAHLAAHIEAAAREAEPEPEGASIHGHGRHGHGHGPGHEQQLSRAELLKSEMESRAPGTWRVVRPTKVRAEQSLTSDEMGRLAKGTEVEVVKAELIETNEQAVQETILYKGQISPTAALRLKLSNGGWISVLNSRGDNFGLPILQQISSNVGDNSEGGQQQGDV